MKKPEDDPATVTLVASNLLGKTINGQLLNNWSKALKEARNGLQTSHWVIKVGKEQDAWDLKSYAHSDEALLGGDYPLGETEFIESLVEGLSKTGRADRRKAFAVRLWALLVAEHPQAPSITESGTWTPGTLKRWRPVFVDICRKNRAEIGRANQRRKR